MAINLAALILVIQASLLLALVLSTTAMFYLSHKALFLLDRHLEQLQVKFDLMMAQQKDTQDLLHVLLRKV